MRSIGSLRFLAVMVSVPSFALVLGACTDPLPPRHGGTTAAATTPTPTGAMPAATGATPTGATPAATTPATYPTPAPVPTYAPVPTTPAPVPTTPSTAPTGAWPGPMPPAGGFDPAILADLAKKAGELGLPGLPGAATPPAPAGDPLDAAIRASGAKYAPGFTPASPMGRATLKQGEHAGMNYGMKKGKCYVVLGAAAPTVTTLGIHLMVSFGAAPAATLASDTSHGNAPVLGADKPLCPPVDYAVRVDSVPMVGGGNIAVQIWEK